MKQPTTSPRAILFADHSHALGGAEHSLLLLMQHLDRMRWQPHLACPAGDLADAAQQMGIPWYNVSLPRLRRSWRAGLAWYQGAAALARITEQIGAKALVANTVRAAFYGAGAGKLGKRPFLWHMRDFWLSEAQPRYPQLDALLKKALCRQATQVIANSAATARHLPCPNVAIIHNGVDLNQFKVDETGQAFRQRYHIPPNAPLVGIVGRLRPWKGQHHFIEMAAIVAASRPETHFVIVGGTPFGNPDGYTTHLQKLAIEKKVAEKLHFTGQLKNVTAALSALDIFVHSGDPEPFGLVNIEAMAASKPVVAFAHGALPEIVLPGQTGWLAPPYDISELADAVLRLLQSAGQRQAMGRAGRQRVKEMFTIQQTAENMSRLLQKTAAGAG